MKVFYIIFEIFCKNNHPSCYIEYKRIDLAPCNKLIMANKLFSTNLEQFLGWIQSPLTRY